MRGRPGGRLAAPAALVCRLWHRLTDSRRLAMRRRDSASWRHGLATACAVALIGTAAASCVSSRGAAPVPACEVGLPAQPPAPPSAPDCDNAALTSFAGLLVLAPHPDDEVLGFAGLIHSYLQQHKPVAVVIATDGDAYCEACRFWKSASVHGLTCDARDLADFETPATDSFAEVRRAESTAALSILGAGRPIFLGYPDTGLAAAWDDLLRGEPARPLRRSDFSACRDCESCASGYGSGPITELTAASLMAVLAERISATSPDVLLATTHRLDGHGDHAALGSFVERLNGDLESPRAVAYAVIHANSPQDTPHPDCWYPAPPAAPCPCAEEACAAEVPGWIQAMRQYRLRPDWPAALPADADYGEETQLCLPPALHRGEGAVKLAAVRAYASQLGFAARDGRVPEHLEGILDCSGYLLSFVRRSEAFVLVEPPGPSRPCR